MALEIRNRHPRLRVALAPLRRWLAACLGHLQQSGAELSVLLADDDVLRELNRVHRGKDKATDVLSFGMREHRRPGDPLPPRTEVLGDLAVSLDAAARQAAERGLAPETELRTLLAHGLLHLLGYDHARLLDEKRMFALQDRLVSLPPRRR